MESHFSFETVMNYRDDYNGRPDAIISGNHILLVTHPFYCFANTRYGRCYRYNVISKECYKFIDVDFYTFNNYLHRRSYIEYSDVFDRNLETIMNYLSSDNHGNLLFACIDKYNVTYICFVPINNSVSFDDLVGKMESGKISDIIAGFVRYDNRIYTIYHFTKDQMDEPNTENGKDILPMFKLFGGNNNKHYDRMGNSIPWTKTGDVLVDQINYYYHKVWNYKLNGFDEKFCDVNREEIEAIDFRSFFERIELPNLNQNPLENQNEESNTEENTMTNETLDVSQTSELNVSRTTEVNEFLSSIGSDEIGEEFDEVFQESSEQSETDFVIDIARINDVEYLESIPEAKIYDNDILRPHINYLNPKIKNTVKKFLILKYDVNLIHVPNSRDVCGCIVSNHGHIQIMIW